jgi:hypothetical protein
MPTDDPIASRRHAKRPRAALPFVAAALWLAVPTLGFAMLLQHQYAAGDHGATAAPREHFAALGVEADSQRTLIITLHPHCPCSNTTLEELRTLLAESGGSVRATALFVVPAGVASSRSDAAAPWAEASASWHRAATIPGLERRLIAESEARTLGPRTSGHVLLFDADGVLRFDGGITLGRGHAGDNDGRRALGAALVAATDQKPTQLVTHPVYGCGLFDAGGAMPTDSTNEPSCCAESGGE